jgi:anti-anti-sigma factor
MAPFTCLVDTGTDGLVVTATGELDLETGPRLRSVLVPALNRSVRVRVDMRQVSFVDVAGLRELLACAQRAGDIGAELVVSPSRQVCRLLELTETRGRLRVDPGDPADLPGQVQPVGGGQGLAGGLDGPGSTFSARSAVPASSVE